MYYVRPGRIECVEYRRCTFLSTGRSCTFLEAPGPIAMVYSYFIFLIEKSPFFAYAFKIDESIQLLREVEFNWKRLVSHHLQYPHTAHGQQQHRLSILYTQQSASIRSSASVSLFFKLIE